jgi:hypothetical protein
MWLWWLIACSPSHLFTTSTILRFTPILTVAENQVGVLVRVRVCLFCHQNSGQQRDAYAGLLICSALWRRATEVRGSDGGETPHFEYVFRGKMHSRAAAGRHLKRSERLCIGVWRTAPTLWEDVRVIKLKFRAVVAPPMFRDARVTYENFSCRCAGPVTRDSLFLLPSSAVAV